MVVAPDEVLVLVCIRDNHVSCSLLDNLTSDVVIQVCIINIHNHYHCLIYSYIYT